MDAIGDIYLAWRKGKGHSRIIVGVIKRNVNCICFEYIVEGVEKANEDGFTGYTDFRDFNKIYNENVIDIFGQRLTKIERLDIQKYYDFWDIDIKYKEDKYYLLAHTQGMLATDNFEFLADYQPVKGLNFVSEICGLSHTSPSSKCIATGDELLWKYDKKNVFDKQAIAVYKDDIHLGWVKRIHCNVFHKPGGEKLKIKVHSMDKNGMLNKVFINISF
ncbi:MAG: hypothetical protein LBK94_04290 [Prevotellaceae bacterium]|jgi:hypothetical protein|nr:hypothetical protein [Prevotellaceae bacterium]